MCLTQRSFMENLAPLLHQVLFRKSGRQAECYLFKSAISKLFKTKKLKGHPDQAANCNRLISKRFPQIRFSKTSSDLISDKHNLQSAGYNSLPLIVRNKLNI